MLDEVEFNPVIHNMMYIKCIRLQILKSNASNFYNKINHIYR